MSKTETGFVTETPLGNEYTSARGVRVQIVNGVEMMRLEDIQRIVCDEIARLPKETRPAVLAAQDARQIVTELTLGIGGDMERFRTDSNKFVTELRQCKFAVVTETKEMLGPLKEIRQFFLGSDYTTQMKQLREFVELCERLKALKDSGFLDTVADTMLKLA